MTDQWDDLKESAREVTTAAARTPAGKALSQAVGEAERLVADRPVNALWRSLLLGAGAMAMLVSAGFAASGRKHEALYVGQWVPTLLIGALWLHTVRR
jgi:hypothetical protein